MANSDDGIRASETSKKQALSASPRKIAANRKNALKSTGPKTPRGTEFSSRNSWKHGLFARQFIDFFFHSEDPDEYKELWEGLRKQFRPMGAGEELELEVERIAQCWWRLKRAYRYENAMNILAQRNFGRRELAEQAEYCKNLDEQEKAAADVLQGAQEEVWAAGAVPQEVKDKISALMPGSEVLWPMFEAAAEEHLNTAVRSKLVPKPTAKDRQSALGLITSGMAIRYLRESGNPRRSSVYEVAVAQHVIPNREALDKILRYETSIERSLNRALERLERMQNNRQGEKEIPKTK